MAGIPAVIEEVSSSGVVYYVREPGGELVASLRGGSVYYYHFDGLGSTRAMTNSTGNVTDTYSYDAWGNVTSHIGSTSQPYQYVGQLGYYTHYQEPDFGLPQLGVRFYDSMVGRFTQRSPLTRNLILVEMSILRNIGTIFIGFVVGILTFILLPSYGGIWMGVPAVAVGATVVGLLSSSRRWLCGAIVAISFDAVVLCTVRAWVIRTCARYNMPEIAATWENVYRSMLIVSVLNVVLGSVLAELIGRAVTARRVS
jgi:RHS repeat-associated protein